MNSFLIIGTPPEPLHSSAPIDTMTIDDASVGIDKVREIGSFLSLTPFQSENKVVVIENAQNLSIEAQNALLKVLEEPPPHSQIFLKSDNIDSLLPTIVSRCQITDYGVKNKQIDQGEYANIWQNLSPKTIADHTPDRNSAFDYCQNLILFLRKDLPSSSRAIRSLQKTIKYLNANTNLRLTLDQLLLDLGKIITP